MRPAILLAPLVAPILLLNVGCATLRESQGWGSQVTLAPGWDRVGRAALQAAQDPWTWGSLAVAAGLQLDNADHRLSDWAQRRSPVFATPASASQWSDRLRSASVLADGLTVLLEPESGPFADALSSKLQGGAIDLAAATAAIETTHVLKTAVGRERPDGSDSQSFPSGHATTASTYDALARINLESLDVSPWVRSVAGWGLDGLSVATAWARVEAGAHYPSDTLVGMAIGNFSAIFFKAAFADPPDAVSTRLALEPQHGGVVLRVNIAL